MPKIGIVFKNIAAKLGVDVSQVPELAQLENADFEVPEAVANAFQSAQVFSEESAKNNPKLKAYFFSSALDPADKKLAALMDEFGFPEDAKAQVTSGQGTYERIALYSKKLAELKEQRDDAKGSDKTALTTQINQLNSELAKMKAEQQQLIDDAVGKTKGEYEERIKNSLIFSKMASRKLDTSRFPAEMMQKLAYDYMVNALKDKGATLVNDNDSLKLKQSSDAALDYYQNNQLVSFDDFLDEVLANNKLLAVNDQPPAPGVILNGSQRNTQMFPNQPGGARPVNTGGTSSAIDKALADYEMGTRK